MKNETSLTATWIIARNLFSPNFQQIYKQDIYNHVLLTIFAGCPLMGGLERPLIGKPWFDSFVTQGKVTSTMESS